MIAVDWRPDAWGFGHTADVSIVCDAPGCGARRVRCAANVVADAGPIFEYQVAAIATELATFVPTAAEATPEGDAAWWPARSAWIGTGTVHLCPAHGN